MSDRPRISWVPMGQRAILLRFADQANAEALEWSLAFSSEIERDPPTGVTDWIPAVTSLLIEWEEPLPDLSRTAEGLIERLKVAPKRSVEEFPLHEVPVRYSGPDLAEVAAAHEITPEQVGALHSAGEYRVYMLGFSPGFAYLGPLPQELHTPRRADPRPRVPAGSVAIGGEHTAIYPQASPGGWHLIGKTDLQLFEPALNGVESFRFKPGDRVRFVAT